jgi:hypothetical protein
MSRAKAVELLNKLEAAGISESQILLHILNDFMSGADSVKALESAMNEFDLLEEDEELCPSCGSADIFNHHFDYDTAQVVYQCRDCDDGWS